MFETTTLLSSKVLLIAAGGVALGVIVILISMLIGRKRRYSAMAQQMETQERLVLQNVGDGVVVTDEEGQIIDVNDHATVMFGYSRREMLHLNFGNLLNGDPTVNLATYKIFHRKMKKKLSHREPAEEIRRKDSTTTDCEARYVYAGNDTMIGIFRDLSRARKEEAKFFHSDNYIKQIFDLSFDMIVVVDKQRRIIEFNRAAQKAFGYTREEVLGKHVDMLYSDSMLGKKAHGASFAEKEFQDIYNKRKNGDVFHCLLASRAIYDEKGEISGLIGFSREVTDQPNVKEQLRITEQRYSTLFANTSDGIFRSDPEGNLLEVNPALAQMLGYSKVEDIPALDQGKDLYVDPAEREKLVIQPDSSGSTKAIELQWKRSDGKLISVAIIARPIADADGKLEYVEGIVRRLQDRKRSGIIGESTLV